MPRFVINNEKNGIELYFEKKPSELIRETLKSCGWRWSSFGKFWYNFNTASNLQLARDLCNVSAEIIEDNKSDNKVTVPSHRVYRTSTRDRKTSTSNVKEKYCRNSRVLFSLEEKTYVGTVLEYNHKAKCVLVKHPYFNGHDLKDDYQTITVDEQCIIKQLSKKVMGIEEYDVVKFVSRDLKIKKGIISRIDDNYVDIEEYVIGDDGYIDCKSENNMDVIRIIEKTDASFLPIKVGDKVEFYPNNGITKYIGTISQIDNGYIWVKYNENSIWGRETRKDYVRFDNIRMVETGRRPVNRNSYISETDQKIIDQNETIKNRIKDKKDIFVDASKYVSNDSLYRHQRAGTILAHKYNKFAFFYDTGTGKTVMALDVISTKEKEEGARFLIIAPKSIIKTAWMDDAANYYPELRILPLYNGFNLKKQQALYNSWHSSDNREWKTDSKFFAYVQLVLDIFDSGKLEDDNREVFIKQKLDDEANHFIINSEMFIRNPEKYIKDLNVNGIIMDESAILKNYNGKTAETMREMASLVKYVYLLSGKPAPNNITEYFSQMKIVDPDTFNMSYEKFLSTFCYSQNRVYKMIPENEKIFAEMVSIKSLIVSKKDCLDLPDTVDVVREIELPESIMRDYNELYEECMARIKGMDDSEIYYSASSKLAVLMKLRQMASGFFIVENQGFREEKIIVDIHNAKIEELNNIMDQLEDEQVIIWCQFQHEIEMIEKELSKRAYTVTAYGKTKDLEKNIDDFKTGKAQYIIAHPKTLKYGVTFTNCKYTVYYSFSYSAEDYDQSHDRNYRLGQKEKCTYLYIQAADTIDEIMYAKVKNKLSDAEFFELLIKDAAKHGIDYTSLKSDSNSKDNKKDSSQTIHRIIRERGEDSRNKTEMYSHDTEVRTTYDYLNKIKGPTYEDLLIINNYFIGRDAKLFQEEIFEKYLFDFSRPDYFDYIHANEQVLDYDSTMTAEDFYIFLRDIHPEDKWAYELYRDIDTCLNKMKLTSADVIRFRYGLMSSQGKKQTLNSVARNMRIKYGDSDDYTWNVARVSSELPSIIEAMRNDFPQLEKYIQIIYRHFMVSKE